MGFDLKDEKPVLNTSPAKPETPAQKMPVKKASDPRPPTPARPARLRSRHYFLGLFFLLWVVMPLTGAAWYLFTVADDQYASTVGFSVHTEEARSTLEFLGGITELSGSGSTNSDTDILYAFIQSQEMVRTIHLHLDLVRIYSSPEDPIFSLGEDHRIEALMRHWRRMVTVFYDNASGLIEIRALAFDPDNAHAITTAIFAESSQMINRLSAVARADATRYAQEELTRAVERLKSARQARTAFQNRTQIVDPVADIQSRMGILHSLQAQLANTKIERQLLLQTSTSDSDPRVLQVERKLSAIQNLIEEERGRFGAAPTGENGEGIAYSALLAEFEALQVDLEFAEKSYLSAQATYDVALAESQRTSRHLAAYISPTKAETAEFPRRIIILLTLGGMLWISWAILTMIFYSLRDRR